MEVNIFVRLVSLRGWTRCFLERIFFCASFLFPYFISHYDNGGFDVDCKKRLKMDK